MTADCTWKDTDEQPAMLDALGMIITELDQISARQSGMETTSGIIVKVVMWGSAADRAGVTAGDIIAEVDGMPALTIEDMELALALHIPQTPIGLLFQRSDMWRFLALPFEENNAVVIHRRSAATDQFPNFLACANLVQVPNHS